MNQNLLMAGLTVKAADAQVPVRLVDLTGYIADEPVQVPEHPYYLRAVQDGDLILVAGEIDNTTNEVAQ